jgi:hypothetical protein
MWWPALFIFDGMVDYWSVASACMAIECVIFVWQKYLPHWKLSFACSLVGNLVSFSIGTVLGAILLLPWHYFVDPLLGGTFHPINWCVTIVVMLAVSIGLEALVVRLATKMPVRKFLPVISIGNLLMYVFLLFAGAAFGSVEFGPIPTGTF